MAAKPLPSPEVLRQLLRYEPETGKLFWQARDASWFRDDAKWTATEVRKRWNSRYAGREAFTSRNARGYHLGAIGGRNFLAHRVIWAIAHGVWPTDEIDHINLDHADNRLVNLRAATRAENEHNKGMRISNTSGLKGVSWDVKRRKWEACLSIDGKKKYLGRFETADEAHEAFCRAARRHRGEFARTG